MVFSSFRFHVGLRVVLLVACVSVAVWGWIAAGWLALLCAAELIWYVERSQREFSAFLSSILHQDYSMPVPSQGRGRTFVLAGATGTDLNLLSLSVGRQRKCRQGVIY